MSILRPIFIAYPCFLVKRFKYCSSRVGCEYIELRTFKPVFLRKMHGAFETTGIIAVKTKNEESVHPDAGVMQFFNNCLVFIHCVYFFPHQQPGYLETMIQNQ